MKGGGEEQMPVLLMFYPDMSSFIPFTDHGCDRPGSCEACGGSVGVHLDHGKSYDVAVGGIAAGFPSIMYDGSARPYERIWRSRPA